MEKRNSIESLFVPYKEALVLKELGFNEQCLKSYGDDEGLNMHDSEMYLSAPLYQQAFIWFRDKHNMLGTVYSNASGYLWEIHDDEGGTHRHASGFNGDCELSGTYTSYEKAEVALLQKLINLVKK